MINIEVQGNYIYLTNLDNNIVTDRPSCDITIVKKYTNSTAYTVYYRGETVIDYLCSIEWSDFTLNGNSFATQQDFEDWKNLNTANCGGSSGDGTSGSNSIATLDDVVEAIENIGTVNGGNNEVPVETTLPAQIPTTEDKNYHIDGGTVAIDFDQTPNTDGFVYGIILIENATSITNNSGLTINGDSFDISESNTIAYIAYNGEIVAISNTIVSETNTGNTDTTAPVITLNGASTIEVDEGGTYTELGATANDDTDGDITANIVIGGTVDTSTVGTYTITYNVSDTAGNNAVEVTRTVNVNAVVVGNANLLMSLPFDGDLLDSSGNSNNPTGGSNISYSADSSEGTSSAQFDGSSGSVLTTNFNNTESFTIFARIKQDAFSSSARGVSTVVGNTSLGLFIQNSEIKANFSNQTTIQLTIPNPNVWVNVMVTVENSSTLPTLTLYCEGLLPVTTTGGNPVSVGAFRIGSAPNGVQFLYNKLLDDFRIYSDIKDQTWFDAQ